jgi:hypothetical protein
MSLLHLVSSTFPSTSPHHSSHPSRLLLMLANVVLVCCRYGTVDLLEFTSTDKKLAYLPAIMDSGTSCLVIPGTTLNGELKVRPIKLCFAPNSLCTSCNPLEMRVPVLKRPLGIPIRQVEINRQGSFQTCRQRHFLPQRRRRHPRNPPRNLVSVNLEPKLHPKDPCWLQRHSRRRCHLSQIRCHV